jgi:hypothetical protein
MVSKKDCIADRLFIEKTRLPSPADREVADHAMADLPEYE